MFKLFILVKIVWLFSSVSAQGEVTPATGCSGALDVAFIVDSSSSVGPDNFQIIREFLAAVVSNLEVGEQETLVSIARYNNRVDSTLFFDSNFNMEEVLETIANMPYNGRGTRTAQAIDTVTNQHLQEYNGWRDGDVPTVVIVLTDGRSQDSDNIPSAAQRLKAKATRVIAIGVGNAEKSELDEIATNPIEENVIVLADFSDLVGEAGQVVNLICEALGDVNECREDSDLCQYICINTHTSFYCECQAGFMLETDGRSCADIDECAIDNGGCSHDCINTPGSYQCSCPSGLITAGNSKICVPDSCFENDECEQICNNVVNGAFYCSCNRGYNLNEDKRLCDDIDECLVNNGGCEYECNNTAGGYICTCPDGMGLRNDGRTCGTQCYTCSRALNNADCNQLTVCGPNQKSCQTTTRLENGVVYISKQCKQTEACASNFIQNPRTASSPTQCNSNADGSTSVCRCCCHSSQCNQPGACSLDNDIGIDCPDPALIDVPANVNLSCSGSQVGDICTINCPVGYQATESQELSCTHIPRTLMGFWKGTVGDCEDINECDLNNGGCSHICTNTNGSFACSCPDNNPCRQQLLDLYFILDSSSSVGQDNFNLMIDFVASATDRFTVSQDDVRVGVMTYNNQPTKRFDFLDVLDNADFLTRLRNIDYAGRGTRTALAISTAARDCFTEGRGRRSGVPLAVVVITDGRSRDWRQLPEAVERLYSQANEVLAIGISDRVNEEELLRIANGDSSNYRMVENFENLNEDLINLLAGRFCTQPEQPHTLTSDLLNCDFDECSVNNGGCSHECVNTVGSYFCTCLTGMSITNDRLTCDFDECTEDNGECEQGCINTLGGFHCLCGNENTVEGFSCAPFNECLDENGDCSDVCVDLENGYRCECPERLVLGGDGFTCVQDSCFNLQPPFVCSQNCVNILDGLYMCTCDSGYTLDSDGHNCTEIDECEIFNGGCEQQCVNTPGSYHCECTAAGQGLREDRKTCGILCHECQNVLSNDECDTIKVCGISHDSCFATIRRRNDVVSITKGCQQTVACINNLLQNPRDQCNSDQINSKCECCCTESLCNVGLCPYNFTLPGCPFFQQDNIVFQGLQDNGEIAAGGTAILSCPSGFVPGQNGEAPTELNCNYNFVNETSEWNLDPNELDVCVDVDECEDNVGLCVDPGVCVNNPGSFECVCPDDPDDYELVDGVICERDECADGNNGGCSHNCTNSVPGFSCFCPAGYSLVEDSLTCDPNECEDGNGGCFEVCINIANGFECGCHSEGSVLAEDGITCIDINECETENGGCSHICNNLSPGYECSCPENMLLLDDGFICRLNPCFGGNGGCEQICTPIFAAGADPSVECKCNSGYNLLEDGSCIDINECATNNGGCQHNCSNTDGGYSCICPTGQALHQNGRTCGRACYSCQGAATNEECNAQPLEICSFDANSCENEVRVHTGRKMIFKRCKQEQACLNNYRQNPRIAVGPTQCNGGTENDVCRCCCVGHLCNVEEKPCESDNSSNIIDSDSCLVGNGGCDQLCTDTGLEGVNCSCNPGYMLGSNGKNCFDLNECNIDNGGCSHRCVNTQGSFFCECPEKYQIDIDARTCTPRPGPADCPESYQALGHSCLRVTEDENNYQRAVDVCRSDGSRLVKIADDGNRLIISRAFGGDSWIGLTRDNESSPWIYSDGTDFKYEEGWAFGEPSEDGTCGYLNNRLFASLCFPSRPAICELARSEGFMVFTQSWENGAQGKLYFPTDVNTVLVTFPQPVSSFNVWFGSVSKRISSTQFVVSQDDNERQSSQGQAEYVIDMRDERFPDIQCTVEPYTMS